MLAVVQQVVEAGDFALEGVDFALLAVDEVAL